MRGIVKYIDGCWYIVKPNFNDYNLLYNIHNKEQFYLEGGPYSFSYMDSKDRKHYPVVVISNTYGIHLRVDNNEPIWKVTFKIISDPLKLNWMEEGDFVEFLPYPNNECKIVCKCCNNAI